jgi:O-antigen ligase
MFESNDNVLRVRPLGGPGVESSIVLLAVVTAALLATQPLFPIYLLPAILLVLALLSFDSFVYATVFLMPWYPLPNIDLPVRDAFLLLRFVMFVGVWILRCRSGQPIYEWLLGSTIKKFVFAYATIATISLFLSPFALKLDAFRSLVRFFSYLALFYAISGWIHSRIQIERLIKLLLISTIAVALFGFYQELSGGYSDLYLYLFEAEIPDWNGRISSFLFHFNALAAYLNLIIPFAIGYMVLANKRSSELLGWICLCTAGAALYLTGSRGGLLAFGGILFLAVLFIRMRLRPGLDKLKRVITSLVLAGVVVVLLVPRPSEQEQSTRLQDVDEFTELSRLALWGTAAMMFTEHPILGAGYGNYKSRYIDYLPDIEADKMDAHNLYLQLLSETGILGFACFMIPVGLVLWRGVHLLKETDFLYSLVGFGVAGALVGTLIHGCVDYFFHVQTQVGGLFWLIMALGLVVSDDCMGIRRFTSQGRA